MNCNNYVQSKIYQKKKNKKNSKPKKSIQYKVQHYKHVWLYVYMCVCSAFLIT